MKRKLGILFSFPLQIGRGAVGRVAEEQVRWLTASGASIELFTGRLSQPAPDGVRVHQTLRRGAFFLPTKLIGIEAYCRWHDRLTARALARRPQDFDLVYTSPLGALETLKVARRLGIPTVLDRPNAHTSTVYEVVARECERLGYRLPKNNMYAANEARERRELAEYQLADKIACASEFVAESFRTRGVPAAKILRIDHGFDPKIWYPPASRDGKRGLHLIFAGRGEPGKGLHFALDAWLSSEAKDSGRFTIAGEFIPSFREYLGERLNHPSIHVIGFSHRVPELFREADALILPSVQEGGALVSFEARACGCALLVTEAVGAPCRDGVHGFIHRVGDVATLREQINRLHRNPALRRRLQKNAVRGSDQFTWEAAVTRLFPDLWAMVHKPATKRRRKRA